MPWAETLDEDEAYAFVMRHSVDVATLPDELAAWLAYSYAEPLRYLETRGDRHADGMPDRTRPPELRTHNGRLGQKRRARCADRRAWTWEARFRDSLDYPDVIVAQSSAHLAQEVIETFGGRARLLPVGTIGGGEALYRASGALLEELTG